MSTPLLIFSDAPNSSTGLGRISRELALRIHQDLGDVFRVATIGGGSDGPSPDLPFQQFGAKKMTNFVPDNLPGAWNHFAKGERGILLCILNPGWTPCIANPELLADGPLKDFLRSDPFEKWLYAPIDGDSVGGRLPKEIGDVFNGFDRVLAYTAYGAEVIAKTMRYPKEDMTPPFVPHLPHGLNTSVFYPRDRHEARKTLFNRVTGMGDAPILDDVFLIGVCATSTARKDFFLLFEVCAELVKRGVNVGLWIHSNTMRGYWNIPMLAREFGMEERTIASNRTLSDEDMAWSYSALDHVMGIASGGGWEFPHAEGLACRIPVTHGNYAGGAEFLPKSMLVEPVAFRGEGIYGLRRPVFRASDWADRIMASKKEEAILPSYIFWENAWKEWRGWLLEGVK